MDSQQAQQSHYRRNYLMFILIGTMNNFPYVVAGTAAQSIAQFFHADNLIGVITWANVCLGFLSKNVNAFLLEGSSYKWRVAANGCFMLLGMVCVAVAPKFWVAVIGVSLIGMSSSFGESVILGYLRQHPSELVGGWSSGTGWAGVVGSAAYLGLAAAGLSNTVILFILAPVAFVYVGCFFMGVVHPPKTEVKHVENRDSDDEQREVRSGIGPLLSEDDMVDRSRSVSGLVSLQDSEDNTPLLSVHTDPIQVQYVASVAETRLERILRLFRATFWLALQLGLVYCFEYIVSAGCSDRAVPPQERHQSEPNPVLRYSYISLQFCYQAGVLVSRSSLRFVRFRRLEILTALQAINLVFWLLQDEYKFLHGEAGVLILFGLMFYVGLLGGAVYVNVFYLLLHDSSIDEADKDLAVNVAALYIAPGIMLASLFIVVMDNSFLKWA